MIGIDTNVLARYYIEDKPDPATASQKRVAQKLMESGGALMVSKSVILEFEWVMRGYYGFAPEEVLAVLRHLMQLDHVTIEDRVTVEQAVSLCEAGIEFADALHHASYRGCTGMATFDDRKFARRARKLGVAPMVFVPS